MDEQIDVTRDESTGLGRRQLIRAGAWAVPTVVMVAGAPLAAATGGGPTNGLVLVRSGETKPGTSVPWVGTDVSTSPGIRIFGHSPAGSSTIVIAFAPPTGGSAVTPAFHTFGAVASVAGTTYSFTVTRSAQTPATGAAPTGLGITLANFAPGTYTITENGVSHRFEVGGTSTARTVTTLIA